MGKTTFSGPVRTGRDTGNADRLHGTLVAVQEATVNATAKIGRLPNSNITGIHALVTVPGSAGAGGLTIQVGTSGAADALGSITVSAAGLYQIQTGGTYTNHKGFSGDVYAALVGASAGSEAIVGVTYRQL